MTCNQFMRYIPVFEAVLLNLGTGLLCLAAPAMFVAQFATETLPAVSLELIRWYGILLWVLTFFVLRILPCKDNRMLSPVVEALLFGDLLHLAAIYLFYQARPEWNFSFVIMLFLTVTLALLRCAWVYRYYRNTL